MNAATPTHLGGYTIEKKLSEGGMGAVLLGVKRSAGGFVKKVAIKTVLPEHETSADYRELFFDEAKLAARLTHPHLCQVFDFGEEGGALYLVMEFVEGMSVEAVIRHCIKTKTRVPPGLAARIIAQAARGLHHAHTLRGDDGKSLHVVHRDVSPQNIIVTPSGNTKVIDFGIAKSDGKRSQTQIGVVRGKPGYMAPEQARGLPLDARTDIFQLGIVLHELIGLAPLYLREDIYESIRLAVEEPPPRLAPQNPEMDPALDDVIQAALAKDPAHRFSSADAMARALDSIIGRHGAFASASALGDFITSLVPPPDDAPTLAVGRPEGAGTALLATTGAAAEVSAPNPPGPVGRPLDEPTAVLAAAAAPAGPNVFDEGAAALPLPPSAEIAAAPARVVHVAEAPVSASTGASTDASVRLALGGSGRSRRAAVLGGVAVLAAVGLVVFWMRPGAGPAVAATSAPAADAGHIALAAAAAAADAGAPRVARGAAADAGPAHNGDTIEPEARRTAVRPRRRKPGRTPAPTPVEPAAPPPAPVSEAKVPDAPAPRIEPVGRGTLVVRTKTRAEILVDGRRAGNDFDAIEVSAGAHRVEVRWADRKMTPEIRRVTVKAGQTLTLKVKR